MKSLRMVVFFLLLLPSSLWAWGPTTHSYIASCVTEGVNRGVLFGAIAPDVRYMFSDPATATQMRQLTHAEFDRLAPASFTTGFKTHNDLWGADSFLSVYFDPEGDNDYGTLLIRQISTEFGVSMNAAKNISDMCVDIQVRLAQGPEWGTLMADAARASGAAHEQLMVDAFAQELAARVGGLSPAQAAQDIRGAMQALRTATINMGVLLESDEADIHAAIPNLLALQLGCDLATAEIYYSYGMAITADIMDELDYICNELKIMMPGAVEGEDEGEPEGEGEGEAPVVVDFCAAFHSVYTNDFLRELYPAFAGFVDLLDPAVADVNGSFSVDSSGGSFAIEISGNGMLDAANELGLLERVLNHPHWFPGNKARSMVLDHPTALAAWEANLAQLETDIGALHLLLVSLAPGLKELLAGFITLGDGNFVIDSMPTPSEPGLPFILSGEGSYGLVAGLFIIVDQMIQDALGSGFANPYLQRADYVFLDMLAPDGDADGDGYSNAEEYAYFSPALCAGYKGEADKGNDPAIAYPTAALDYRICPSCISNCPECTPTSGLHRVGGNACLHVPGTFPPDTFFDWSKAGVGPLFGAYYEGVDCQTLRIYNLEPSDSGTYICTYGPTRAHYQVSIVVASQVPAYSYGAMLLMSFLMAGFVAWRCRPASKASRSG